MPHSYLPRNTYGKAMHSLISNDYAITENCTWFLSLLQSKTTVFGGHSTKTGIILWNFDEVDFLHGFYFLAVWDISKLKTWDIVGKRRKYMLFACFPLSLSVTFFDPSFWLLWILLCGFYCMDSVVWTLKWLHQSTHLLDNCIFRIYAGIIKGSNTIVNRKDETQRRKMIGDLRLIISMQPSATRLQLKTDQRLVFAMGM